MTVSAEYIASQLELAQRALSDDDLSEAIQYLLRVMWLEHQRRIEEPELF